MPACRRMLARTPVDPPLALATTRSISATRAAPATAMGVGGRAPRAAARWVAAPKLGIPVMALAVEGFQYGHGIRRQEVAGDVP